MKDLEIGKLISGIAEKDAIHVAIAPVIAGKVLHPGEHVGIVNGMAKSTDKPIGIVDPFLPTGSVVKKGQRFWLMLYPGTISSLRHHWIHASLPEDDLPKNTLELFLKSPESQNDKSKKWLEDFASEVGIDYDDLLDAAANWVRSRDYLIEGGRWEGTYTPDEFWPHYENITGEKIEEDDRGNFFTCSC